MHAAKPISLIGLLLLCFLGVKAKALEEEIAEKERSGSSSHKSRSKKTGMEGVGENIKALGEQVASRVDRIIKKKGFDLGGEPWTFQGIPLIFPSAATGFNLGLHFQLEDILTEDPHKMEIEGQILASDKGRYKDSLKFDYPHAFDGKYRVTAEIAYNRDITFRYYGIGNVTRVDPSLVNDTSPLYQNVRAGPKFTFQMLRYMGGGIRLGPIAGLHWTQIIAPPGSLLARDNSPGIAGGRTHYLGLAIIRDTLDFEPYPSRGTVNELYFYVYNHATGSDYDFLRATYTFRWYTQLHRKLILAHRTLLESTSGDVPYYELGAVGGSDPTIGFGNDRFLRGYDSNRFIDKLKFATGFELRWDPIFFTFAKQDINIGFVPFVDIARVWPTIKPWPLDTFHAATGIGNRIIWNSRFIIRTDFSVNQEGTGFAIQLGNSF